MERGLTLLLASLMLAVGLTACGGDTTRGNNQNDDAIMGGDTGGGLTGGDLNDGLTGGDTGNSQTNGLSNGSTRSNSQTSGLTNGSTQSGRTGSASGDIRRGLDDVMRDAGNAMDDMVDDLTGTHNTRNTRSSGPSWNGNLSRPEYAKNSNITL